MSTEMNVESIFTRIVPTARNAPIWSSNPILRTLSEQQYLGRVIIEVWSGQTKVIGRPSHTPRALAAIQGTHIYVSYADATWANKPVTIGSSRGDFLGRIIIELWDKDSVITSVGASLEQLRAQAIKELQTPTQTH